VCCDTSCAQPLEQCNQPGQIGTCTMAAAPVPAASSTGLIAMLAALMVAAFVALRLRRI
jgi:MYXO-CTERM domain-containing protein